MNSRGEHRATAGPGSHGRVPRTAAAFLVVATVATAATWAEVHYAGRGQAAQSTSSSSSQDSVQSAGPSSGTKLADLSSLSYQAVLPATVSEFAATTGAETDDLGSGTGVGSTGSTSPYQATRYAGAGHQGSCADAFTVSATTALTKDCAGYLTADYVQQDHAVYSSVTVLVYADRADAAAAAKALALTPAAVKFRQPGSTLPDVANPVVTAAGLRVQAIGSVVDVVQSVDTEVQSVPDPVSTPSWYLAYMVGSEPDLAWQ